MRERHTVTGSPTFPAAAPSWHSYTRGDACVVLVAMLLVLCLSHPLVHGDGLAQFIYLDSVAGDGDLDLSNQAQPSRFGGANTYHMFFHPVSGAVVTSFPFGSAFLLAPFYWLGHALDSLVPALRAHPDYFWARQGLPLAYSLTAMLGTQLYTLAAVWLSYRTAQRVAAPGAAALAALALLAGTPLLYYATIESLSTHAIGAFLIALALWLATRPADGEARTVFPPSRALALGLTLGLATLVRWQLLLYAVPVGVMLLWRSIWTGQPQRLSALIAFSTGVGLFGGLCVAYFWLTFGGPLVIPTESQSGLAFMEGPLRHLPQVVFHPKRGWFVWSPVVVLGLIGLVLLVRAPSGQWRVVALTSLAGVVLEIALNASLHDWEGGWAFGQRRMTEAYGPLVVGTAWLISQAGRWQAAMRWTTVVCGLFGLLLLVAHLYYTHTSGHPDGGTVAEVLAWLATQPHGPSVVAVFRDRYGPWAWARPEL